MFDSQYDGAFSEHLEMLSQLGYVCLFSSAFPLAAMAALLGNLLELRGDAFKLCFVLQRPFGRRVSNIGTWQVSAPLELRREKIRTVKLNLPLLDRTPWRRWAWLLF